MIRDASYLKGYSEWVHERRLRYRCTCDTCWQAYLHGEPLGAPLVTSAPSQRWQQETSRAARRASRRAPMI